EQPDTFAFTPGNLAWAEAQIAKYPDGRQASAVIPLLWRAQEQEGWVTKPAIEAVAEMLGMASIRVLEVASFYFMFQLQPVGSVAHIQVCGTTSCMICGAEDLVSVCKDKIARRPHEISSDGRFSWEEVECLGACSNAPMVQIGKDYFEDLDRESFAEILDGLARGEVPAPGSRKGRFASEPEGGLTSLHDRAGGHEVNASKDLARRRGDTIARITGPALKIAEATQEVAAIRPEALDAPHGGTPDDLTAIKGVGPKLETLLHSLGIFHLAQIASWSEAELAWIDSHLEGFKGRASRDNWKEQARTLLSRD
ncbi:MAG: NADH-quinone oxidoreductase subunit NuoE, partial [Pseudomonadota bacterium]